MFCPAMNLSQRLVVFLSGAALLLAGCGEKPAAPQASAPAPEPAPATAQTEESAIRTIEVVGNDTMRFSVTEIKASPGETLRIRLTNGGTLPKQAMGHNLILLHADADPQAYAAAALQAVKDNYEPPALADQVIAATKMLGPKESDTITFTVPETPGNYPYLCSFPAHLIAGMKGVLVVE